MQEEPRRLIDVLRHPRLLWKSLREYLGLSRKRRLQPITDVKGLQQFINTRASFVAQTSLYGYLRTRAGMRYPELFNNDPFVVSINIAKWQIWLACLSDLCIYAGGLLAQESRAAPQDISQLMQGLLDEILEETGIPPDAGKDFAHSREQVRQRLAKCDWKSVRDDETPFVESPQALVQWAPVMEELKQLDEEIVKNSVRFRWQEIRRDLRRTLQPDAVRGLSQLGGNQAL